MLRSTAVHTALRQALPARSLLTQTVRYESSGPGLFGWFNRDKSAQSEKKPESESVAATQNLAQEEAVPDSTIVDTTVASDATDAQAAVELSETTKPKPVSTGWVSRMTEQPPVTELKEIRRLVSEALALHSDQTSPLSAGWHKTPLQPLQHKLNVVTAAMEACHTRLPSHLLINMETCGDLVKALHQQALKVAPRNDLPQPAPVDHYVARYFETKVKDLPPNMAFVKFDKKAKLDVKRLLNA